MSIQYGKRVECGSPWLIVDNEKGGRLFISSFPNDPSNFGALTFINGEKAWQNKVADKSELSKHIMDVRSIDWLPDMEKSACIEFLREMGIVQVRVINYHDVWGNAEDGYEVNNQCEHGFISVFYDEESWQVLLDKLKEVDFFKQEATLDMVSFDFSSPEATELTSKVLGFEGYPIGRLEWIL